MDKEQIKSLAANPDLLSGIFNYCDRWCERCPFTSRCLNYALGEEQFPDPESRDIANEKYWRSLEETLRTTLELLKELAEEKGVSLDALDTESGKEERRLLEEAAKNHPCSLSAKAYGERVDAWFDSAKKLFEEKEETLSQDARLGIPNVNPAGEAFRITDAAEVIRWYQHQIYVKLMRALHGELEERPEILKDFPKGSDGSAKVALIGIDRSIAAWGEMRSHFQEREDDILDLLIHLDRLRRSVEKTFPKARAFQRPGFDRVPQVG
jgi:hypothetical protein